MSPPDWENAAVRRGTERMLALRSERLAAGETAVGWKLAFGAPASLERFGLARPLLGFITDATVHASGAFVSCDGWEHGVAEPEIAVYIGEDVGPGSNRVADAIAALGPAIELANVHPPRGDIEEVLAGDIFHKAVILGDSDPGCAGGNLDGLQGRVLHDGAEIADTTDLEALTGDLLEIIGHSANLLAAAGEGLRARDVVITGSIVPPLAIEPGQEVGFELAPFPAISVRV